MTYEDRSKPGIDMAAVDRDMAALEASRDRWKERAERLEAELTQCSDELGSTRMALNDEMYKRDAERQYAARLEAALRAIELRTQAPIAWFQRDDVWCLTEFTKRQVEGNHYWINNYARTALAPAPSKEGG